ncbi:urocanate hydratase [Actinomadura decatromicini]|uniref:Urocanate hydratase n=1 Tax=Actinomadura decatromicini TaxID=2604572 RepID=A0A5D3FR58_9ACTN|nr:urocanate hydratase [Actinomadura decatromicini]TYK51277.1 urocanate hydratase [Actinomadura decatromicini]
MAITTSEIGKQGLRCRGPRQETLLRMLENTLSHAERPDDLIVYAGLAKAARDHAALEKIVRALTEMEEHETLVIQSGKPIGVFPTGARAPLVLMANSNLVGRWATSEHFYELEKRGLIAWGGYTAGDWQYIGSQGIVQGTYQTLVAVADEHFGGDLAGRLMVTAGLGGMGGAQPLATVMAGGVALCVEVDADRIKRRVDSGYLERGTESLDEALAWAREAMDAKRPASIGLLGNAAEVLPALRERGLVPDVVTDQTAAHDLRYGYVPAGMSPSEAVDLRDSDPEELARRARASIATHVECMLAWQDAGSVVFEYGNNLRAQAAENGVDAFRIPIFVERYIRPLFCRGLGPFRWVATSGEQADIDVIDDLVVREFPDNPLAQRWIPTAREFVRQAGLPSRISWLAHGERAKLALLVNDAVRSGELRGPVAFTRDHLDPGGVSQPLRETENMPDGSDAVSDWPLLNALLNAGSGADLVAIHAGGGGYAGYMQSAGVTLVADGTAAADDRITAALTADTGIGIMRYADAGYETAADAVHASGLRWFG